MTDNGQLILNYLQTNWTASNVDDTTPAFVRMVSSEYKYFDFNENNNVIISHVPIDSQKPAGFGTSQKETYSSVNIDVRFSDGNLSEEAHFEKLVNEVKRIIETNLTNPPTGWQEWNFDNANIQDLSDKRKGLWRKILPVKLMNYNVIRG